LNCLLKTQKIKQEKTIFLSYRSENKEQAYKIDNDLQTIYSVTRDERSVKYKENS